MLCFAQLLVAALAHSSASNSDFNYGMIPGPSGILDGSQQPMPLQQACCSGVTISGTNCKVLKVAAASDGQLYCYHHAPRGDATWSTNMAAVGIANAPSLMDPYRQPRRRQGAMGFTRPHVKSARLINGRHARWECKRPSGK